MPCRLAAMITLCASADEGGDLCDDGGVGDGHGHALAFAGCGEPGGELGPVVVARSVIARPWWVVCALRPDFGEPGAAGVDVPQCGRDD